MSVFVIAEAGVNHNGSIDLAYKLIDKVKKNSILITTSDTYSKYLDKKDRSTIPLFSDGGAAILINYSKNGLILKNYYCNTEPNTQADLMGTNEKGFKIPPVKYKSKLNCIKSKIRNKDA